MQGVRFDFTASGQGAEQSAEIARALEDAFSYRGDVTIELDDGSSIDGYVFDRRTGPTLEASVVRILPRDSNDRREVPYARIRSLVFSGRDPAAGKTWENWVRRYAEKKLRGESAGIECEPLE